MLIAVRFDVSGEETIPTDTFRIPRPPETTPGFRVARDGASGYVQVPFGPRHRLRFDGRSGLWTGTGGDFRLLRTTLSGDTTRIAERTGERPPVPEAALDDWKRSIEADWGARSLLEMDLSRIPGVKPAFTTYFLDHRRHLWAARSHGVGVYREYADSIVFDVLDTKGRWLGSVTVGQGLSRGVCSPHSGDRGWRESRPARWICRRCWCSGWKDEWSAHEARCTPSRVLQLKYVERPAATLDPRSADPAPGGLRPVR